MNIAGSVLDLMGNTPLVYLDRLHASVNGGKGARVAAKLEMFNPGFSVKDRIGLPMIRAGEKAGLLKPGGTIVEPTSGNTGLGLTMAATLLGYRMVCVVPDKIPIEKQRLLQAYGAKLVVCPTNVDAEDPRSYYKVSERIRDEEGAYLPYQYYNQSNPEAHVKTTGPEIWRDTDGRITHFVAGVGTGGTISGTGRYLHRAAKKAGSSVKVLGVDTVGSVYAHYFQHREFPKDIHQYLIDGIGEDFMPSTVWWDEIDGIVTVPDEDAYLAQARLAREESVFTGSSGGAAVHGALQVAAGLSKDDLVVTLLPDGGERYLSKFNLDWLAEKNLDRVVQYLKARDERGPTAPPVPLRIRPLARGSAVTPSKPGRRAAGKTVASARKAGAPGRSSASRKSGVSHQSTASRKSGVSRKSGTAGKGGKAAARRAAPATTKPTVAMRNKPKARANGTAGATARTVNARRA